MLFNDKNLLNLQIEEEMFFRSTNKCFLTTTKLPNMLNFVLYHSGEEQPGMSEGDAVLGETSYMLYFAL